MADLEKTVSIVFKGVDDLSKTVQAVSTSMDSFSSNLESATQPLADMAANVLKIEGALSALALGGLALAVNEAGKFGDSFNEITTLIDGTTDDFDQFKKSIMDYASESKASIDDINASVYAAISAGVNYKNSLDLLTTAEKLSIAGKADLESSTKVLASTLNAYGAATSEAGRYSDVFFQTVKLGQTTLPELSSSLSQVTGVAAAAGIPIETLGASIAALTASGAPTTQAITSIKSAISNIIKPSSEAEEAAEKLGIKFDAAALKSKGFEGVLNEVYKATGGNVDQMAKFFGSVEGLNAALVLGSDKGGKFAASLNEMKNAAGSTDTAFAKMADNMNLAMQNLENNLKLVLITIGTPLLDEAGDIASGLSDIFKGIKIGIDAGAFDPVFTALESFGQKIAETLRKIAEVMPEALANVDFENLVDSFEHLGTAVSDAFAALFGDVDLTTAEGLATVIQKIVDAVSALTNISAGIVEAWTPFIGVLGSAIEKFSDADESTQSWVGNILGLGQAINSTTGLLSGFAGILGGVASGLTTIGAIKYLGIATGIGSIAAALVPMAIGGAIGAGIYLIADYISNKLTPAIEAIPEKKDIKITLDDGNVLELATGIIRDLEGEIVSIPLDVSLIGNVPDTTSEQVRELLLEGSTDAELNYTINSTTENLSAALKEMGVLVTKEMSDALKPITDLPKKIEPLKLIDVDETDEAMAKIKADADILKTALEWTAKVNIAQAEADTKKLEAAFDSINETVKSTGDLIGELFGAWDADTGISKQSEIMSALDKEQDRRDAALKLQERLTDAEIKLIDAKTRAMEKGESLIKIEAPGLQPHLEAFMWEILEAIQVRASEEGAEFLLGI